MRRISLRNAPQGVTLARPMVDERGAFVLAAGKSLSLDLTQRLWDRGFRYAYVEHIGFGDLDVKEPLEPHTYMRVRQLLQRMMLTVRDTTSTNVELPLEELHDVTADVCEELARIGPEQGFLPYPAFGALLDQRVASAINIGIVAAIIGRSVKGDVAARHLFSAAMLQDLGLWRATRTQEHVAIIKQLLRPMRDVSPLVKAAVAQHHERLDGTGYPEGMAGEDMHPLAKIMSTVVAYVELVSSAGGVLPHEAQEAMMAGAGTEFDLETVKLLMKYVPGYPVGTVLKLSDGRVGVVVDPGPSGLNRPRVRILPAEYAQPGQRPTSEEESARVREEMVELDLSGQYTLTIASVIE